MKVKELLREALKRVVVSPPDEASYLVVGSRIVITTDSHAPYRWMQQRVNVDFNEGLDTAVKRLARDTGANLVVDARMLKDAPFITMQLRDVSLETAVFLMADTAGMTPLRVGNSLYITTKANAKEMRADPSRASLIGPCPLPPEYQESGGGPPQLK
jgi:hypothetical protein